MKLRNLALLHQAGQTPDLPHRLAEILGQPVESIEALLAQAPASPAED